MGLHGAMSATLYSSQHAPAAGAVGAPGAAPPPGPAGAGGSLMQDSARPPEPLPPGCGLHEGGGSEADFAALSDFEDDGAEDEEDEDLEEEEDEDDEEEEDEDGTGAGAIVHGDGQPYPGFVPVALKYLDQSTRPRSWCLAMITNPYPLALALGSPSVKVRQARGTPASVCAACRGQIVRFNIELPAPKWPP